MRMKIRPIQSRDNPRLKQFRALLNSNRARQQHNLTVLEGVHLCTAWLQQHLPVQSAWVSESGLQGIEIQAVLHQLPDATVVNVLPDTLFQPISMLESGAGLCFMVKPLVHEMEPGLAQDAVVLDAIQDPGNIGTLLRTAAAAGVQYAWLGQGCASAWAPKTLRAGMGAQCVMSISEGLVLHEFLPTLRTHIVAADVHAHESLYEVNLNSATAWVFGNEGQGLSNKVLSCVQKRIFIPQSPAVESMNVAAAAAVSLFEMRRQRLAANKASN
jgi:TrmH family RNA methyltransferase